VQGEQTADDMAQLTRLGQLEFDRRRWLTLAAASEQPAALSVGWDWIDGRGAAGGGSVGRCLMNALTHTHTSTVATGHSTGRGHQSAARASD
jgi:hypothetical protein